MEARAYLKYARISPRKVQIVLDLIRNQPADKAMAILKHTPKAASELLEKVDYVCQFRRNDHTPKQPSSIIKIDEKERITIIRK